MKRRICISAPAKINLGLQVLHRRDDGFHEIETVFVRTPFADKLMVELNSTHHISIIESGILSGCSPEQNLAYKAAEAFLQYYGIPNGVTIYLHKQIPTGAGLGGGSSDAAAALQALQYLFNIPPTHETHAILSTIALQLGSDVPFFLLPTVYNAARGSGRGEELQPIQIKLPYFCVLAFPMVHVSTAQAYRALGRTSEPIERKNFANILINLSTNLQFTELFNDFEKVILPHYPKISYTKQLLTNNNAEFSLMSGSGSSVFGLFTRKEQALQAQLALHENEIKSVFFSLQ
jgi:4-diphosphocytidyl-2-C-methyl-D-erythritol kinase